jgi:hypothetical protein
LRHFIGDHIAVDIHGSCTDLLEVLKVWKQATQFSAPEHWVFSSPARLGQLPWSDLRLKVFGDVTRPLGDDGFVDVAPVAIF